MEEKIKIYLSEDVYGILMKDAEFFEFYKKDRTVNRNDFLNTLIVNYFDSYSSADNRLYEDISRTLSREVPDEGITSRLSHEILNLLSKYRFSNENTYDNITVSLKPTRKSAGIIDFIQNNLLNDLSLSGYFRNLFASYCQLPQDRREQIIFREKFEVLSRALGENRKVYFTTVRSQEKHIVSPYAIARSQEELFNYLICLYNGAPFSFRLTRIQNVHILKENCDITDEQKQLMEKMRIFAPQFAFYKQEEICVRLTAKGVGLYNRIYSYRPKPTKIVKDLYYFDCSAAQVYHYFLRFGRQARVIYPESLRIQMLRDYENAAREYGSRQL